MEAILHLLEGEQRPKWLFKGGSRAPLIIACALMVGAIFLLWATLSLRQMSYFQAFPLTRLEQWLFWPSRLLFRHAPLITASHSADRSSLNGQPFSGKVTLLFALSLALLCLLYLLACRYLPRYISQRAILLSTLFLGLILLLCPVLTSQDVFSYIAYARMGVIYHLNPLTTLPTAIRHDPVFPNLYWTTQPSAYGPTWIGISGGLQWLVLLLHINSLLSLVLSLRLLGLTLHLGSTLLIWQISGRLLRGQEPRYLRTRLAATLAFAWNPLLLFEACVNAHNDSAVLFLVLLAIWLLLPWVEEGSLTSLLLATVALALAACLKITFVVLFPGLLLFLWSRRRSALRAGALALVVYVGLIVLLYAPFWDHGAALLLFKVNPAVSRTGNTPYDFLARLDVALHGKTVSAVTLQHPEALLHRLSLLLFGCVYALLCLWGLLSPRAVNDIPGLVRWLALAWLAYCFVGSPWYFPWYLTTFVGLAALALALDKRPEPLITSGLLLVTLGLLTLGQLAIYCTHAWRASTLYLPFPPHFSWISLQGLWAWCFLVPAAYLCFRFMTKRRATRAGDGGDTGRVRVVVNAGLRR